MVGAFLEMTALAQLIVREPQRKRPKTNDVTIDYLSPARAITTYARAHIRKVARRNANVNVEARQSERGRPAALTPWPLPAGVQDTKCPSPLREKVARSAG